MAMGESLGLSPNSPDRGNPGRAAAGAQPQWTAAAISQGERLAQTGEWVIQPELLPELPKTFVGTAGELAIATLPISLFYYDNLTQQRHYLAATVAAWGADASISDAVIVFGYAIAQAIKEQLVPSHFIAQILTYLHVSLPDSASRSADLICSLETLKRLIADGSELQGAIAAFELDAETKPISIEIAIALYCFLQTPDTISLALNRAVRLGIQPDIVGALVGALAGAYISTVGIPAEWHCGLRSQSATPEFPQRVQHLSAHLVAAWSGVYHPSVLQEKELPIVTVPWVVRSQRIVS